LSDTDAQSAEFLRNCLTEPGARLRLTLPSEKKPMLPVPSAHAQEPEHHDAPAFADAPVAHEASELPQPPEPAALPEPAAPAELHASTQVAEPNGVPDLSQIQGLAGGNPIVTVILALILVGGGTAGWKFWQKKSEQSHELKLQELELQKEMAGLNGAQPPPCQAASAKVQADVESIRGDLRSNGEAHKKLQEQIDELSQKLAKLEKKAASAFSADFDAEDVVERLEKAEKELKALKTASKAKKA
jgi:uncharacterized protein HemX